MTLRRNSTRDDVSSIKEEEVNEYLYETLHWYMDILKKMDHKSFLRGDRFSRSCSRCSLPSPHRRFVSTQCGHTICSDCAEWTNQCIICLSPSHFIPLVGDSNGSRDCSNCPNQFPHERSVFSKCGHSVCRACAYHIKFDASFTFLPISCPRCKKESDIIDIIEDVIPDNEEDSNLYAEIDDSSLSPSPSTVIVPIRKSPFRRLARYVVRKIRKMFSALNPSPISVNSIN